MWNYVNWCLSQLSDAVTAYKGVLKMAVGEGGVSTQTVIKCSFKEDLTFIK